MTTLTRLMPMRYLRSGMLPLLVLASVAAHRSHLPPPATVTPGDSGAVHDTLRLYYMGHAVGYERYDVVGDAEGTRLSADFDYSERGRRTHLASTYRVARDYTPQLLEIARVTDAGSTVDTRVEVRGRMASVLRRDTTRVALPAVAFAISGNAPVSQNLLMLRYWLAHGKPKSLGVVPGGPVNPVTIEWRGRDTIPEIGTSGVLDRYAVNGVVWGFETVWLDGQGRIAGLTTRTGNLTLEAVRVQLEPYYARLMASATRDRLADLAAYSVGVRPIASGTIALEGATLIDGTGRDAIPNATVVVTQGRIVAAGPRTGISVPAGAQRINVAGKTIMPGLWDMHTHAMMVEWAPVYLAAGVTTVRDMGNELDFIVRLRAAVDSGHGLGPHLLLAGLVDGGGPNSFGALDATTPAEGVAIVNRYHQLGFEQIKLYDLLKPDVVGAITREAHRLGMTVTGHVPRALGLLATIDSGQDHIAHLAIRGEAGSDSVARVIAFLKMHGTVMDPTESWNEMGGHSAQEPVAHFIPGTALLPPVLAQRINASGSPNVDSATAHARLAGSLAIIQQLHEAGVLVVAGTDNGVPGFSVYREVELYEKAGFSRMDALRAATAVSARAMRLDGEVGTLEPGKRADLIVLDANPLDALANLNTVRFVMKQGVTYRTADIWKAMGFQLQAQASGLRAQTSGLRPQ